MERDAIIARFVNVYLLCSGCYSQVFQCGRVKIFTQVWKHGADEVDAGFYAIGLALAESQSYGNVPYQVTDIEAGQNSF